MRRVPARHGGPPNGALRARSEGRKASKFTAAGGAFAQAFSRLSEDSADSGRLPFAGAESRRRVPAAATCKSAGLVKKPF